MAEAVAIEPVDRTGWPDGPWSTEPDREQWRTSAGLPGLIQRNRYGVLCGYVAVPLGHPAHGRGYDEVESEYGIDVHGGLTYADKCFEHICHVPEPGEPDDVWWFGFDSGHAFDVTPAFLTVEREAAARMGFDLVRGKPWAGSLPRETYRDLAYVRAEVERLAEQLAAVV